MGLFDRLKRKKHMKMRMVQLLNGERFAEQLGGGYTTLDRCPEVVAACYKIASLIASMTIYLMANTEKGDVRIKNELSRKIDIEPNKNMTRSAFMTAVVMNLLLYGDGNSVVYPHTDGGLITSLEPIAADRVTFSHLLGRDDYRINIDNVSYDPADLLHFTLNPDRYYLWHGTGFRTSLKTVVDNLSQAQITKNAFMKSKWKPSLIIKVDALTDEFSSKEGREKLLESYFETAQAGQPWMIPAQQFEVEQVKPLSLSDLAINDATKIDKSTVAAILGIPSFVLGVGDYKADEWNSFISNTIRPIAQSIEQEMTRKLILSPKMYLMFNVSKLYSYDLQATSNVYSGLYDKGIVTGNEVREKIGMQPLDGLDNLIVLENYIPVDKIGEQKKLGGSNNA